MPTIVRNPDGSLPIEQIQAELYQRLIDYSVETFPDEHRKHLGVSAIGDKCDRKLYNIFRWVKLDRADPRMRRLWNRGKREEEVFSSILTWMGFFVREIDPATNKQYRFSKHDGHYGGSGDTIALLPWFRGNNDPKILCEYKTHNNKLFQKLQNEGLKKAHWKHWVQMCSYGKEFGCEYGLYCAVNKDNDEIFFDFIKLDWNVGIEAENKARDIIYAQFPPRKISTNPSDWNCSYCHFAGICHNGEAVEVNCRSCRYSKPVANSNWFCNKYGMEIPKENIAKGCASHDSVMNIVAGG